LGISQNWNKPVFLLSNSFPNECSNNIFGSFKAQIQLFGPKCNEAEIHFADIRNLVMKLNQILESKNFGFDLP
jgi:hypothetical protein